MKTEKFISNCILKFGKKYDYSKTKFIHSHSKVCIICPEHGEFWQRPSHHLDGGCPKCSYKKLTKKLKTFKEQATKIHNNKYDYSKVNYITSKTKIIIICKYHGEFLQTPDNHLSKKHGCPKCKCSIGENLVEKWLIKNNIEYIQQKRFSTCKGKNRALPFDFYLPKLNTCIEYNGRQHYEKESKYYSDDLIQNDKIKIKFCKDDNINLIIIPYWENVYDYLNSSNLALAD